MTIDVIDLRDFYSQRLGIVARRLINRGIHARWPNAQGQRVLGLGYPTPYLGLFREDAERCIAFMPAAQGVLKWPTARPTLATLVDEFSLPLPDAAVDRILLVHALEMSDDPERLLRLLNNPQRPVQLIMAGKAHPADQAGQALIQEWTHFIQRPGARAHLERGPGEEAAAGEDALLDVADISALEPSDPCVGGGRGASAATSWAPPARARPARTSPGCPTSRSWR